MPSWRGCSFGRGEGGLMEEELEITFLSEVRAKADFASDCVHRLNRHLNVQDSGVFFVFECIYSYLNFAANVSLILWPSPKGPKDVAEARLARGAHLRDVLDIKDDNPLNNRGLRNHIAHMDERLDAWWIETKGRNLARQIIGPRNSIQGLEVKDIFEHYIPNERIFIFRGEEYNIQQSFSALSAIRERTQTRLRALGRYF